MVSENSTVQQMTKSLGLNDKESPTTSGSSTISRGLTTSEGTTTSMESEGLI